MQRNDPALWFFASTSTILLLVSAPATYAVVSPFHSEGDWVGVGLALATLLAFELGAVGCKLVTLAIPQWGKRMNMLTIALLGLTTIANYANGFDLFSQAHLAPTLAVLRDRGYAPLVSVVYAATIPLLLFVFLTASVARIRQLSTADSTSLADRRDTAILTAIEVLTDRLQPMGDMPQPSPIAAITDSQPKYPCPYCGVDLAKPGLVGLARRYGYCTNCKIPSPLDSP